MACGMDLQLQLEALRRVYRKGVEDTVHVEDVIHIEVRLLPILSDGAMREIVREILAEKGWERQPDGTLQKSFGATVATLDEGAQAVTLRSASSARVTAEGRVVKGDDQSEKDAEKQADKLARANLESQKKSESQKLALRNLEAIGKEEPALRGELQEALNRTYRRALETKARELGEVESIQEAGKASGTYEVTVVVKA